MNTLIENLNALMTVKKELNKVLVDNEQPGGPVFDTYPEQFRELFRVLEDKLDDIEEGPYATYQHETVVAKPTIGFENNVVTLTCATQGAEIHFRKKDVYGNVQGDSNYVGRFSISRDTWIETYAILNGVRSSKPDNSRWCYYQAGGAVPAPEFDRTNGIVTITCRQQGAQIWWRIMPSTTFVLYTGPELVDGTKWLEAYAVYQGKGSETAISEGTEEGITVEDPVLTCTDNVVTITCATEDAVIWYKTNLDNEWTVYTEPIEISVDTEFTAYAYKEGNISNTVTESFEYEEPYVPPVVVPADPVISCSNNVVTITCSTIGATIYYSTDNGVTYNEYTGTITISADTTFYAYSELNGETSNTVSYEAQYEDSPQPVAPADPVISCTNNIVTITCSTSGAVIWYSTDGGNTYNIYTEPISISADTTFYAYSTKDGLTSNIVGPYVAEYEGTDYSVLPLTFEILSNGKVGWKCDAIGGKKTIQYRKNNGSWYNMTSTTSGVNINVSANDIIQFRGSNSTYYNDDYDHYSYFTSTCNFNVSGNIMSLLNHNFSELTTLSTNNTFHNLFYKCIYMINAYNLVLPATTLKQSCYNNMFYGCSSLTTAPSILPATILEKNCYDDMFWNCTSLTNVPILPATTLVEACYAGMFEGCSSLTTAPILPATTLAKNCYYSMFNSCTSLRNAPVLPATTMESGCYWHMFAGCTSLTIAPTLPATTLANSCYMNMFIGCSSLTTAPTLPATTLAVRCYDTMFYNCTSLRNAPVLPATTLEERCYALMFYGCTSLTTAPTLPATTLAESCYYQMFYGCTSLTTAPFILPATTLTTYCYFYMFYGCTSLTIAPELPATTLVESCYCSMFIGCTNLNYIKCLAINKSAPYCLTKWVENVSSSGTFVKKTGVSWSTGDSGIPSNWTVQETSS